MAQYKKWSTLGVDENELPPETMTEVPRITDPKERHALVQNNKVAVIYYFTDWCGPCKHCSPRFAVLAKKYGRPGLCAFAKEDPEDKLGKMPVPVRGVPCFHFYVNGHHQDEMTITGADVSEIEKTIQQLLS